MISAPWPKSLPQSTKELLMRKIKNGIFMQLFLFLFWLLLTDFRGGFDLVAGVVVTFLATLFFGLRGTVFCCIRVSFRSFIFLIIYCFIFFIELVKANLDVALRVVKTPIPINPGIVKIKTGLRSKLGRIILANSITLTPGPLTVETDEEHFYIHWIDVSSPHIEESTREIAGRFERYLEVIFG